MIWSRFSANIHFSPWPAQVGLCVLGGITSLVIILKTGSLALLSLCCFCLSSSVALWSMDMVWESESGEYSLQIFDNLKLSFSLFVLSEMMLLFSLFWGFLHFSLSPTALVGHTWPPLSVETIAPSGVPLFNTILLVSSGVTVTWAHHLLLCGSYKESSTALAATVGLGLCFLFNQGVELKEAMFSLGESAYGSLLFTLTGLHGFHVFLGLLLLLIGNLRLVWTHLTNANHISLEMSIWYWHFVDCIWLIVYSIIYWWGN